MARGNDASEILDMLELDDRSEFSAMFRVHAT
jgi:hypothetical protein